MRKPGFSTMTLYVRVEPARCCKHRWHPTALCARRTCCIGRVTTRWDSSTLRVGDQALQGTILGAKRQARQWRVRKRNVSWNQLSPE